MEWRKITDITQLHECAVKIRTDVVRSLAASGSGHLGGSLGLADVFTVLYFNRMKHDPKRPDWPERDRLVVSIGHVAPVYYATLANAGYFPEEELLTLRKLGSRLQGHPGRDHQLPGLELSAGSLGQGLSVATGMALADKMDHKSRRVFCIAGDGELQEGSIWEAAMAAAHHRLGNLILTVDRNRLQIDGPVSRVMEIEPLADKWRAFGWHVLQCDGNDIAALMLAYDKAEQHTDRPSVILANTLMCKGIRAIENVCGWHGKAPTPQQAEQFITEIEKQTTS